MNTINNPETDEKKLELYLKRVDDLFSQIREWFKDDLEVATYPIQVGEPLGRYEAPALLIRDNAETLANLTPKGATVILAEGLLELKGWLDKVQLDYMTGNGPQVFKNNDKTQSVYQGINRDGWYWIESPITKKARFVDKTLLLKLITLVSDHEF